MVHPFITHARLVTILALWLFANVGLGGEAPSRRAGTPDAILFELFEMIGFSTGSDFDEMTKMFEEDMDTYGQALGEDRRNYRGVLRFQAAEIERLKRMIDRMRGSLDAQRGQSDRQRSHDRETSSLAKKELDEAMQRLEKERQRHSRQISQLLGDRKAQDEKYRRMIADLQEQLRRHELRGNGSESAQDKPGVRLWTDASGRFRVRATLVRQDGAKVYLRKPDGKEIAVPLDKLSPQDQQFVSRLRSNR